MNPFLRLWPYLYAALHSYNSAWELLLLRSERRTATRDAGRLRARFPFLADYQRMASTFRQKLSPHHREYISTVAPNPIAISLELAVFLAVMCEACRPKAILDLGSGFSSYVFRSYTKDATADPAPVVYSVDQSTQWLDETRRFLERRNLDCRHLLTWDAFIAADRPRFDLILQDIADLETRLEMLNLVLDACRPSGMIVIDDMHVPGYRRSIIEELDRRGSTYFSLRTFTRNRLRYSYLILP